ncbi:50S ribosomal protein L5 [Candidatus Nomurabacteria bacterium]|nr:50S ribosomal protein L5 [Candidatus Nomurabacteria bacterium]
MERIKDKQKKAFEKLKDQFSYKNVMQAPRLTKVVVSTGVGKIKTDKRKVELIPEKLAVITGQKPSLRPAKKSIATFKVREGQISGYQVTLRGERMYDFLDRLVNIALPRTRDFRGINLSGVDEMGNYTLGIRENTIFPETADEDLKDVFGMAVTVVTTSKTKVETEAFLKLLGFPFKK